MIFISQCKRDHLIFVVLMRAQEQNQIKTLKIMVDSASEWAKRPLYHILRGT